MAQGGGYSGGGGGWNADWSSGTLGDFGSGASTSSSACPQMANGVTPVASGPASTVQGESATKKEVSAMRGNEADLSEEDAEMATAIQGIEEAPYQAPSRETADNLFADWWGEEEPADEPA